jgi:hypothetical protein
MVVNQDHYVNEVFHTAGEYELTRESFDTRYVLLAARLNADPADPTDLDTAAYCGLVSTV